MDTTDYTFKAPYLEEEEHEIDQVTIDRWYYDELTKISKLTKEYFEILNCPFKKTNEELLKMYNIKKQLNKIL
jgi:hypothetical protein